MTSLQDGVLTPEQYVARHKKAFRVAFDYLNAHFPPTMDEDYWTRAAADIGKASNEAQDPLGWELLIGVYNYLEQQYKIRRNQDAEADNRND